MADAKPIFVQGVERAISELGSVKIQCTLYAEFKIERNGSIIGRSIKNFSTKYMRVFETQDLAEMFDSVIHSNLKTPMQESEDCLSVQSLESIFHLKIELVKLNPLRAGCNIPLSAQIANKRACVDSQNKYNDHCMLFAILAALYPQYKNAEKLQHYLKYMDEMNVRGLSCQ